MLETGFVADQPPDDCAAQHDVEEQEVVLDRLRRQPFFRLERDVGVDQLGARLELGEGVVAEEGEEVAVEDVAVVLDCRRLEVPPRQVVADKAVGEVAERDAVTPTGSCSTVSSRRPSTSSSTCAASSCGSTRTPPSSPTRSRASRRESSSRRSQKFPFVLDKIEALPARRYAVIVDEAHSSQTGEAAADLRRVFRRARRRRSSTAESEDAADEAERGDGQDLLARSLAGRGRPGNLSFFAFTATPKAKTLELFGTPDETAEGGGTGPFHLYSMRQAIEEGFILDVLANYTTYKTYFRIEKAITDDPEYDKARARRAIARFVTLHPHNLAQKRGDRRRALPRPHGEKDRRQGEGDGRDELAPPRRPLQAGDRPYIAEKGYPDVRTLVAFSGKVIDDGDEFTEPGMNAFPSRRRRSGSAATTTRC